MSLKIIEKINGMNMKEDKHEVWVILKVTFGIFAFEVP
jgi:hypothetical protein